MNGRTGRVQFAAERIAIAEGAMIRLGVGVGGGANVLEFSPGNGRLVRRKHSCGPTGFASTEENDGDKSRENG